VLRATLPLLLEPFAMLSPVLDAIRNNALAGCAGHTDGRLEAARDLWADVLLRLDAMNEADVRHVHEIGNAVAFAIGNMEAQLGLASATTWADRLERDPYQRVGALQLRRIARLGQGDWKGAERYRRQAEVMSLQMRGPQMFKGLVVVELAACAKAGDLVGVRDAIERMRPIAARFPGWLPHLLYGEACFELVRGDYEAAKLKCQACIELTEFDAQGFSRHPVMWLAAQGGMSEAWLGLDNPAQARAVAAHALEVWKSRKAYSEPVDLLRVLALAEAKLGEPGAVERLEASIAEQNRLGVTGLRLGIFYEARAQIALWQRDAEAFDRYAELTAREYRYGADSALGARYDRLINEALRHGLRARNSLSDFASTTRIQSSTFGTQDSKNLVLQTMTRSQRADERAQAALQLLCASRNASCGHLYLISADGLLLSASQGSPAPLPAVSEVLQFLTRTQDRAEDMDELVTGQLLEQSAPSALVQAEGTRYELLLLSRISESAEKIAGVAAIALSDTPVDALRQAQLLSVLATHLLEVGTDFLVS
jgi:hypothetical protein